MATKKRAGSSGAAGEPLRVVVVDDHPLWRQTIKSVLEIAGADVVGEATDGAEVCDVVRELKPDVVLMDMQLPSMHGVQATRELRDSGLDTKVLVLSSNEERDVVVDAVRAGACGYILKTAEAKEIVDAVHRVAAGELVFPAALAQYVLDALHRKTPARKSPSAQPGSIATLTPREQEVLALMADGLSNQAIADRLVVSLKTVETHVSSIFTKLRIPPTDDLHRRVRAVVAYLSSS